MAKFTERSGDLVGALTVNEDDEVLVIMAKGNIVRMPVGPVTRRGRNTQGMKFANPGPGDSVVAVARNPERAVEAELVDGAVGVAPDGTIDVVPDQAVDGVADDDSTGLNAVPSGVNDQVAEGDGPAAETPDGDASGGTE